MAACGVGPKPLKLVAAEDIIMRDGLSEATMKRAAKAAAKAVLEAAKAVWEGAKAAVQLWRTKRKKEYFPL